MTVIERRNWRSNVRDVTLDRRLAMAGCPCSLSYALTTARQIHGPLSGWVQSSLAAGLMLRTSQAEHIARGASLETTSVLTGISPRQVLYYLTKFEEEEAVIVNFYNPEGSNG